MTVTLMPHQLEAVEFLLSRTRAILGDEARLGKTYPTVQVALKKGGSILIVAPSSVKLVWRDALRLFDTAVDVRVIKTIKEASTVDPYVSSTRVTIIPWGLLTHVSTGVFNVIILDECHRMQSPTAKRTKAAMKLMRIARHVYALSGTLMASRPSNLWAILTGLGINRRPWFDWGMHFCRGWKAPWGLDFTGSSNLNELKAMVRPHMLRRTKTDVFTGYTPPEFRLITFDRPIDKRESKFDRAALTELANPILSIEGLAEIVHEGALRKVDDAVEFVSDLLEDDLNMKIVVFAHHKDVVAAMKEGLKAYKPVTVTGETAPAMREQRRQIFQTEPLCRVFIGNLVACSEGIDLSVADTTVFVETNWTPGIVEQAASRTDNINKVCASTAYLLTLENSLDHYILQSILRKQLTIRKVLS